MEDFIATRDALKNFLTSRRKFKDLETITGASRSTINRTFEVESEEELIGQYIDVWQAAIKLVASIKNLVQEAKQVLSNDQG